MTAENIPQEFIDVDIAVNTVFQEVFGDEKLPLQFLLGVESDGRPQGLTVGFDPYDMLSDSAVMMLLKDYTRWGIVATGTMWEASRVEVVDGEQVPPEDGGFSTFLFFAMWDGQLITSVRVVRPPDCGDEETGEGGLPYGVPLYETGSSDGKLADAMKFADMMSKGGTR
jgi:hypothetical protein